MPQVELPEAVATLTNKPSRHVHTGKASSETPTTPRNSGGSRSSIAKPALDQDTGAPAAGSGSGPGALKSIFPTYDPSVPLSEQRYAPTQICPAQLPRAVISRQSIYEEPESPSLRNGTPSRESSGCSSNLPTNPSRRAARGLWPPKIQTQRSPVIPTPCSTADLKSLWKVASGWKASGSEGRVFCLKLDRQTYAPVYILSSATAQPFWNLRLDPTSASAYVNLTRHDPAKPYKPPKLHLPSSSPDGPTPSHQRRGAKSSSSSSPCTGSRASDTRHWHEALTTTLEEQPRQRDPNDGLVALLMPAAATKLAAERANDPASVAAAEKECARLVWDEDTATYYLVLNALAKPFCVTTERNPAYSRVEYTLEHDESPKHIAKLIRDGTGGGWLEVDTGVASQIDSCYVLDVVVTALLLIAASEDRNSAVPLGTFAPPPPLTPPPLVRGGRSRASLSSWSARWSKLRGRRDGDDDAGGENSSKEEKRRRRKCKVEGFKVDIANQNEGLGERKCEGAGREGEDELPFLGRVVVKLTKGVFELVLWTLRMLLRCLGGVVKGLHKCVESKY
ncbi:hypothetical protein E4U17_000701 [Claviceps sp. LM77 group G4]|nr:hypothetical protein E4U17_000701 [Claviceps sp. LM77 group G4]KAG6070364.1 hypothetical protein E4U33_004229 [Claviceps sp. LM78 group G4]KAG6084757.1 hypothetical protein E4U16_001123 [Claviceps sp. LM84 group G4]